jgi:hypothetical protein
VTGAGPLRWLAPLLAVVAPMAAGAIPPPPPPTATYTGARPVCMPRFAIRLAARERAERYSDDDLVVTGPGLSLGIRLHPAAQAADAFEAFGGANGQLQAVTVPGLGQARRHRVYEFPGNRRVGWAYWFPQSAGRFPDYFMITSEQFTGSAADYPVLRRVLTGGARRRICPHS